MGINAEPQRTLHCKNGIVHAQKVRRKASRQPRHSTGVLGIFSGFCLCEWAQTTSDKQPLTIIDYLPLVLIFTDLTFLALDQHAITQSWSSEIHDAGVEFVQFQWRE